MERKKTKEEFCRSFEWKVDIKWFDLTGMSPIDHGRHAKIEMAILHSHTLNQCFNVSIINKTTGCIDSKLFLFDDYLEPDGEVDVGLMAQDYKGMYWHKDIAPKSTRPICAAIENYIATFR